MDTREAIRKAAGVTKPAPAEPKVQAPASDAAKPAKEAKAPRQKAVKAPHTCACQVPGDNGCNGAQTKGKFAPGHDAKLIGYLTKEAVAGRMTQEQAVATLKERSGGSALLVSKLESAIPRELGKVQRREQAAKAKLDAKAEKEAKLQAAREQGAKAAQDLAAKHAE